MDKKKEPFNYQKLYRRAVLIIYDVISVILVSFIPVLMRYDLDLDQVEEHFLTTTITYLPINIVVTLIVFYVFKLYDSLWAYAGERELQNLVMGCAVSSGITAVGLQFFRVPGHQAEPKTYYFLYLVLLIALIFASRFSYRFLRSAKHHAEKNKNAKAVMVIGAGEAANIIIKDIIKSNYNTMSIKCIIDDDSDKWGKYIQGIRVVGGRDRIVECADLYDIDEIIVAIPSVSRQELKKILDICKNTHCKMRALPGMYQLLSGEVNVSRLRDVEVEDLLGRDPIAVDIDSIAGYVSGKTVMVTGGGGSIGSELCRQIAGHKPKRLIIVDIYENNAYEIQQEMKKKYPELDLEFLKKEFVK